MKILWIGSNNMIGELSRGTSGELKNFNNGIFIEAIPQEYDKLLVNIDNFYKKHNIKYKALNKLITNENDKIYNFNINLNSTDTGSSSIYEKGGAWGWKNIKTIDKIKLKSVRMNKLINENIIDKSYLKNVVIDVQGAELEVLKSFDKNIEFIDWLQIEVSQSNIYKNGVLFNHLNSFLSTNNFSLLSKNVPGHGDVIYKKKNCSTSNPFTDTKGNTKH